MERNWMMKINFDKNMLKYCLYIVVTATVLYILYGVVGNIGSILQWIMGALKRIVSILSPFIIALVIAYLLHPLVNMIEDNLFKKAKITQKLKRTLSVLITYVLIVGLLVLFIYSTYAMIGGKITNSVNVNNMIESIMKYSQTYSSIFQSAADKLEASGLSANIKEQFTGLIERMNGVVGSFINVAFESIKTLGSNLLNILLGIIIAFYLLKDMDYFKKLTNDALELLFKSKTNRKTRSFLHDVDNVVSKFIRGQLLDGIIVVS